MQHAPEVNEQPKDESQEQPKSSAIRRTTVIRTTSRSAGATRHIFED